MTNISQADKRRLDKEKLHHTEIAAKAVGMVSIQITCLHTIGHHRGHM